MIAADGPAELTPADPPLKLSRRKKLLFLLIIFSFILLIPELATRILAPEFARLRFTKDLTGGHPIGARGSEHHYHLVLEPRKPNEVRIAFLGDSVIWGCGLALEDTIPKQAEAKLRAARPDIFWNFVILADQGVTPVFTRDKFNVLDKIPDWPIDALIYQFHLNDVAFDEEEAQRRTVSRMQPGIRGLFANGGQQLRVSYLRMSAFAAWLEQKSKDLYRAANGPFDPLTSGLAAVCDTPEVRDRWDRQFTALSQMKAVCDQRRIPFRVYNFPTTELLSDDPRDNIENIDKSKVVVDPYQRFTEHCARFGLTGRTLINEVRAVRREMLDGKRPYNRLYLPIDTNHPNEKGAEIFADAVVEDILAGRIVTLPPQAAVPRP